MAPATTSSAEARRFIGSRRRTEAPRRMLSPSPPPKKVKSMEEILAKAHYAVVERGDYGDVGCEQCGSGERAEELLLCDKCDKGFHMKCLRPIVVRVPIGSWLCPKCSGQRRVRSFSQRKIIDFFKIKKPNLPEEKCDSPQDTRKRRRRSASLVLQKKRRRLLPFTPSEDRSQRLRQMGSLAYALTALQMEFSDDLTYMPGMAPRSANQADFEEGGMQVLSKEDTETLEQCRAMCKRGECPPLVVVYDSCEGFTVEADGQIKDMTFIAEYIGDVDFIRNREHDDCDSMMTLLLATDPSKSLVICPDKRGNIARFINGINNYTLLTLHMMPQNRIEHFVAEFFRDVNFFFASSLGSYKSRILIMTYTTRSRQIQKDQRHCKSLHATDVLFASYILMYYVRHISLMKTLTKKSVGVVYGVCL